jgi:hypothetical protein
MRLLWTRRVVLTWVVFAESMRRLGLGDDGEPGEEKLPERPGEADCAYYLRTGACGYGERCRYNHPRDRPPPVRARRSLLPPALLCFVLFFFSPSSFSSMVTGELALLLS